MLLLLTLLASLSSVMGCVTPSQTIKPPRPTLESIYTNDLGGICIDRQDTQELLIYLDALER